MAVPVDRHPDAVEERGEDDDDLGVVLLEAEVADEARLDAVLRELAQELERDVRDDLDVNPGVVVDRHPRDGVDVRDVPPALELVVGVDALDQRPELAVAAHRDVDLHPRDGLGGREACLVLGFGVDRLLDPLRCLLVDAPSRVSIVRAMSAQASAPQLRPLGIGEILDVGIKIYSRNWLTLFKIVVFVVLPAQILVNIVEISALPSGVTLSSGSGDPFGGGRSRREGTVIAPRRGRPSSSATSSRS